jgi:DNA-binding CsgD family transcriptional regulator
MKAPNLEMKERQMLELLTEGASTRVIAKKMGYSEGTVRVYLHNMYKKLGVKNRTEALLWQLEHGRGAREAPAPAPRPAAVRADETFGDVALRDGLLCTLGVMESFIGPYGRIWEVGARLRDAPLDEVTIAARDDARLLWRALLSGSFGLGKSLHDEGRAERWVESSPSEAVLLACLLLIGGYSHAGEALATQVSKSRKGSRSASGREIALLRGLRGALYADDAEAVSAVHHLAAERTTNPVVKHVAIVALYYIHRQRKDAARARETANVLWAEAESARRQLEAMGVRPLSREAGLPRPGRAAARGAREQVAEGG